GGLWRDGPREACAATGPGKRGGLGWGRARGPASPPASAAGHATSRGPDRTPAATALAEPRLPPAGALPPGRGAGGAAARAHSVRVAEHARDRAEAWRRHRRLRRRAAPRAQRWARAVGARPGWRGARAASPARDPAHRRREAWAAPSLSSPPWRAACGRGDANG